MTLDKASFQPLVIKTLGLVDYSEALAYQEELVDLRCSNKIPDTLILVEHPPVITIGKSGGWENILCSKEILVEKGIQVYEVNRGGNVTFHGPGQLVGYPILDLSRQNSDVLHYMRNLEEMLIRSLKPFLTGFGLLPRRVSGFTGVWVGNEKIAAIGVGTRKWVSMHGFALNVNINLKYFALINPCGLGYPATSLARVMESEIAINNVADRVIINFCEVFRYNYADS